MVWTPDCKSFLGRALAGNGSPSDEKVHKICVTETNRGRSKGSSFLKKEKKIKSDENSFLITHRSPCTSNQKVWRQVKVGYLLQKQQSSSLFLTRETSFKDNFNEHFIWLCGKACSDVQDVTFTSLYGQSLIENCRIGSVSQDKAPFNDQHQGWEGQQIHTPWLKHSVRKDETDSSENKLKTKPQHHKINGIQDLSCLPWGSVISRVEENVFRQHLWKIDRKGFGSPQIWSQTGCALKEKVARQAEDPGASFRRFKNSLVSSAMSQRSVLSNRRPVTTSFGQKKK